MDAIAQFNGAQAPMDAAICDALRQALDAGLPDAEAKIWHRHPVWFLAGNPIAGYSNLKTCVRLFFWSGQSFPTPGLTRSGSFKAAELRLTEVDQIDPARVAQWLVEARQYQWNYRDIYKTKGRLDPLVMPA